jgi:lipopolysaccharide transport system permease protein
MTSFQCESRITIIHPRRSWWRIDLGILWRYRDLLHLLVRRAITVKYKQTILGPLWFLLQPLAMSGVFVIVFNGFMGLSTDGQPAGLFYLAGLLGWGYFAQTVTSISLTFSENAYLFSKIYFPRFVIPLAAMVSNLAAVLLQLLVILAILFWMTAQGVIAAPTWRLALLPLAIGLVALLALGVGVWIANTTAKYHDLTVATPFLLQLWMYATPVIYPLSAVPQTYRDIYAMLNPMVPAVEAVRWCLLGVSTVTFGQVLISVLLGITILGAGTVLFHRIERNVTDTV